MSHLTIVGTVHTVHIISSRRKRDLMHFVFCCKPRHGSFMWETTCVLQAQYEHSMYSSWLQLNNGEICDM